MWGTDTSKKQKKTKQKLWDFRGKNIQGCIGLHFLKSIIAKISQMLSHNKPHADICLHSVGIPMHCSAPCKGDV